MFLGLAIGLLLTVSSVLTSESNNSPLRDDGKIVGGFPIDISEIPYQISLRLSGSHICGGSIIAARVILTAAHCTISFQTNKLTVKAGSNSSSSAGANIFAVIKKEEHPKFEPTTMDYDFSVLTLSSRIKFSHTMQPIPLPKTMYKRYADDEIVLVSGWGALEETEQSTPEYLSAANVPIINVPKCQKFYPGSKITERMICAGYVEDACQGDSGGPLMYYNSVTEREELVGIVSWGIGCAAKNYPGVYAKVASLHPWVKQNMK
ncbi:unnamed protein product [Diamesa serratosioi]